MAKKKEPKKATWEDWERALDSVAELFVKTADARRALKEWSDAFANREINPPFREVETTRRGKTRKSSGPNPDYDAIEDARTITAQNVRLALQRLEQAERALRAARFMKNDFAQERKRKGATLVQQFALDVLAGKIDFKRS